MLPILLALKPDARGHIAELLPLAAATSKRGVSRRTRRYPAQLGNISSVGAGDTDDAAFSPFAPRKAPPRTPTQANRLDAVMTRLVGQDGGTRARPPPRSKVTRARPPPRSRTNRYSGTSLPLLPRVRVEPREEPCFGFSSRGAATDKSQPLDEKRVRDLRAALRWTWQTSGTFNEGTETTAAYLDAARAARAEGDSLRGVRPPTWPSGSSSRRAGLST